MTSKSFLGAGEAPVKPHLAKATSEVGDLRNDVDRAFERLEDEIASFHKPIVTPSRADGPPGQTADVEVVSNLMYLNMTPDTHAAYRVLKIPRNFIQNPALHIHWTKTDDAVQAAKFAKWVVNYTVFQSTPGIAVDAGSVGTSIDVEDEYVDAGTTSRFVYRTPNMDLTGLVAGYYMALKVAPVAPVGTPLSSVGLVSLDFTYEGLINKDYGAGL